MNVDKLKALNACSDAVKWTEAQPNARTAWAKCQRGDWMLWLIGKTIDCAPCTAGRKPLLAACLDCADLVAHLRPKAQANAIKENILVLRGWIAGNKSQADAAKAVKALRAAADAADAADAAAYAADAADADAAAAAAAAADAAYAAAAAAAAAAADAADAADARSKKLAQCADIVRKHFPKPPTL